MADNTSTMIKRDLSQEEKVAVLLASMDPKIAANVIQHLEPKTMIKVTNCMKSLGVVPGTVRDRTLNECLRGLEELGGAVQGDEKMAQALLNSAVGEKKAAAMMAESEGAPKASFAELIDMSAEQIAAIIGRELPGVIALVLRHVPSTLSAEILDLIPSEVRRRVIVFMCTASEPSEEIVQRVNNILSSRMTSRKKTTKKSTESDNLEAVAGILQHVKHSVEEDLLSAIQEKSEALATQIRDKLFTFEDIVKLSDVAVRRLMQEVDSSVLGIALRNANMELRDKFFKNMSKRAAEGLKEEMEFSQKVRLTDVEAKQREIVNIIRTLQGEGQISAGTDDYV